MTRIGTERTLARMPESFRELIDGFGGIGEFASAIGVTYGAAKQMRRRNSVGPEYWPSVIAASRTRGIEVDAELLMGFVAPSAETKRPAEATP